MRSEVSRFYKEWGKQHPDIPLTEVSEVTPKMIGKYSEQQLKLKAMEAHGFLHFVIQMFQSHGYHLVADGIDVDRLSNAGSCLLDYIRVLKDAAPTLSDNEHEDATRTTFDTWKNRKTMKQYKTIKMKREET